MRARKKATNVRKFASRWRPGLEVLEARRLLSVWADFNGDGHGDLAIGVPADDVNGVANAGAVNVIYGNGTGLDAADNQIWHLDSAGLLGTPGENDSFGSALAAGDFDGDGFSDLAISAPIAAVGATGAAGAVWTLYGSAAGLSATGSERLHQDNPRVRDAAEVNDLFGDALASGDFNNDGYFDLAIGVPGEDLEVFGLERAGAVQIFYGSFVGLIPLGGLPIFHQETPGIPGVGEDFDYFGTALTVGDFDGDNFDDLGIGVPGENVETIIDAGAFNVIYGGANGLATSGSQIWYQSAYEPDDRYGTSMAAGDFNNDGFDDLVAGGPGENAGADNEITNAGAVVVAYGSGTGIVAAGSTTYTQDSLGGSIAEADDVFGSSVAAGDFDNDGNDDLAIGAFGEDVGAIVNAGAVSVMYGPLGVGGDQYWTQGLVGGGNTSATANWFGYSLTAGDFAGDGDSDLAIGIPLQDVGSVDDAGSVVVLYGQNSGLTSSGSETWHQDTAGINGVAEESDRFGSAVAANGKSYDGGGEIGMGSDVLSVPNRPQIGRQHTSSIKHLQLVVNPPIETPQQSDTLDFTDDSRSPRRSRSPHTNGVVPTLVTALLLGDPLA
jgi:hypothetical protein